MSRAIYTERTGTSDTHTHTQVKLRMRFDLFVCFCFNFWREVMMWLICASSFWLDEDEKNLFCSKLVVKL